MLVGIHINFKGSIQPFTQKYLDILAYNDINYQIMDIQDDDFWERYSTLSAFIFQIGQTSDVLQMSGSFMPILHQFARTPVFPNFETSWHFDDKIKQEYLARFYGLPFVPAQVFWNKNKATTWLLECKYPVVFKLKGGAGSTNVILVRDYTQGKKLADRAFSMGFKDSALGASWRVKYFPIKKYLRNKLICLRRTLTGDDSSYYWALNKNYAYFQEFQPGNKYDTRVTVIGDRAFAFRRFNRKDDFRASGSGHIDYDQDCIDMNVIRIAFDVSQKCRFQSMAYDFLKTSEGPRICEISYTYQDLAVFKCPGFWDSDLTWHAGHFMPQVLILEDLLRLNLKQPDWD